MKVIKIKHSGNLGDIIYSVYAMRAASMLHQAKVVLFIELNKPIILHSSFVHPLGGVMMNEYMFKMAKPLLKRIDFIEDVLIYNGQKLDYNFDKFRELNFNLAAGSIKKWYLYAYPELQDYFDSDYFLNLIYNKENYIVINRSQRYNNPFIDYSILNDYEIKKYFVGTKQEYDIMAKDVKDLEYKEVKDFLELAHFINSSKLFIGNQSMCYAIAELIQTTRLLEVAPACPNVITEGYEMFTQEGFKHALDSIID
jgi:hypothetical protein